MDFDKRTIFAILLIGLILILVQSDFYQKNFMPRPPAKIVEEEHQPEAVGPVEPEPPVTNEPETVTAAPREEAVTTPAVVPAELSALGVEGGRGEDVTVETELYRAVFSTRGASLKSLKLKKYFTPNDEYVELVGQDTLGNLAVRLPVAGGDTLETGALLFNVDRSELKLGERTSQGTLAFSMTTNTGATLRKVFTFDNTAYTIQMRIELVGFQDFIHGFAYYLSWRSGMPSTEPDFKLDMQSTKGYAYQGDLEHFDIKDKRESKTFDGPTDWVALRTKYFTTAVMPGSAKGQAVRFVGTPIDVGAETPFKRLGYDLKMPFTNKPKRVDTFTLFMGPLDYRLVSSFNNDLEDMMDLGYAIFRPVGKVILWSFQLFHRFIPNYGLVIILFSILVKLVLFPLTRKSYQSMKEMQLLQPKMQEMNEKYKENPQKKQQEVMKMYQEYGINPLGGCIPMALQMPLLIALFSIFRSTIELRGASFIWWITDLSRPDTVAMLPFTVPFYGNTVNILPLFMGVTMFIQQKMTMQDPKQKAMVYMMPVFLTFLFNSFPSGLNLYYALFNLFSILQEKFLPYKIRTLEEMKASKASKKKRTRVKHDYRRR